MYKGANALSSLHSQRFIPGSSHCVTEVRKECDTSQNPTMAVHRSHIITALCNCGKHPLTCELIAVSGPRQGQVRAMEIFGNGATPIKLN